MNKLYYGDNLLFMRDKMKTASVDLIYLDPPFNSNKTYNLLYKNATGVNVPEQEMAFNDTWTLTPESQELLRGMPEEIYRQNNNGNDIDLEFLDFWNLWVSALQKTQPKVLAYLVYMTYRLLEMKRVLKPTGSIYLHCDPTASHYIKVMMDAVFGHGNFRNEIIWGYNRFSRRGETFPSMHDIILFYTKSKSFYFNPQYTTAKDRTRYEKGYHTVVDQGKRKLLVYDEEKVRQANVDLSRYDEVKITEAQSPILGSNWTDISIVNPQSSERLGYPTQKPIPLLSRIINASSEPHHVIFDPFCGCGTAIYAAHLNNRQWIGCDITYLAIHLIRDVLKKRYGLENGSDYTTDGVPLSVDGAKELFERDPIQFQKWSVILAGGIGHQTRRGDKGVDGRIHFEVGDLYTNMVISVKGGHLQPAHIRELRGVLEREESVLAGFICLSIPTRGMMEEAALAGQWEYEGKRYDRIQIRTIQNLLDRIGFDTPTKVQTLNWDRQLHLFS